MNRMILDYVDRFYSKEASRSALLKADNYKLAREIAAWKQMVAEKWDSIDVVDVKVPENYEAGLQVGQTYPIEVTIDRKGLPNCLGVELVVLEDQDGKEHRIVKELEIVKTAGDLTTFKYDYQVLRAGSFKYAFRIYPKNPALPHRQDFAYVKWFTTANDL